MIVGFKGRQSQGKTASMVALAIELNRSYGYGWNEMVGNVAINKPGFRVMNNDGIRKHVAGMVTGEQRHQVILLDEVDRVFPSRFFADRAQTETLLGLWQDEKLFNWVLYTCHMGKSVDKIIADSTQALIIPEYDREEDVIEWTVIDGLDLTVFDSGVDNVSELWREPKLYDRWAVVK